MAKATFQKRHLYFIAEQIAQCDPAPTNPHVREAARKAIAEQFADNLASTNPLFDRLRFLRACGVEA